MALNPLTSIFPLKNDFFENVYDVVRLIPKGRVTSYGAIAEFLGAKRSARMVGYAMNALEKSIKEIPAHRVVNRNGVLTGKLAFHATSMEMLLAEEGIVVENDKIKDFKTLFWNPSIDLDNDTIMRSES